MWIRSVLRKIICYKAQHHSLLNEAATTLQHALPPDIMMNNVLPFLELPSYSFEVGDHEEESEDDSDDVERGCRPYRCMLEWVVVLARQTNRSTSTCSFAHIDACT
eukprot:scaffold14191_cov97-Skeletonema_dohrnii-CCMP3373.AAC.1